MSFADCLAEQRYGYLNLISSRSYHIIIALPLSSSLQNTFGKINLYRRC